MPTAGGRTILRHTAARPPPGGGVRKRRKGLALCLKRGPRRPLADFFPNQSTDFHLSNDLISPSHELYFMSYSPSKIGTIHPHAYTPKLNSVRTCTPTSISYQFV